MTNTSSSATIFSSGIIKDKKKRIPPETITKNGLIGDIL
jgi:hypothetical protein